MLVRKFLFVSLVFITISVSTALGQVPTPTIPASTTVAQSVGSNDERYRIGFQDTVEVSVYRQPHLTQRVRVNGDGTINLVQLKPIVAVCRTERELADAIAVAYEKDYLRNPEVNVTTVEQISQSFAVIGAVEKPANYFISRRLRLLELLAYAGGPSKDAGSRIIVARTGSRANCESRQVQDDVADVTLMDLKLREVLENKVDLVMKPGDVVSVMEADVVFVYGNVNKQGQVTMKEPITLTQALASAEGTKAATSKTVRVFRQKSGSVEREEFVYDLGDINKRKMQDPYLEPNDIVAVGEDKAKSILNAIGRSLTSGIGSVFYRIP
jgi:Periplasmic protein involved in polysaccharide export